MRELRRTTSVCRTPPIHVVHVLIQRHVAIPLLKKHLQFVTEQHAQLVEAGTRPETFEELFSTEWVLAEMEKVASRGLGHLTEVRLVHFLGIMPNSFGTEPSSMGLAKRIHHGAVRERPRR